MLLFKKTKLGTMTECSTGATLVKQGTKWILLQDGKQLESIKQIRL